MKIVVFCPIAFVKFGYKWNRINFQNRNTFIERYRFGFLNQSV